MQNDHSKKHVTIQTRRPSHHRSSITLVVSLLQTPDYPKYTPPHATLLSLNLSPHLWGNEKKTPASQHYYCLQPQAIPLEQQFEPQQHNHTSCMSRSIAVRTCCVPCTVKETPCIPSWRWHRWHHHPPLLPPRHLFHSSFTSSEWPEYSSCNNLASFTNFMASKHCCLRRPLSLSLIQRRQVPAVRKRWWRWSLVSFYDEPCSCSIRSTE